MFTLVDYLLPFGLMYGLVAVGLFGACLCEGKGVLAALTLSVVWPAVIVYLIYVSNKE